MGCGVAAERGWVQSEEVSEMKVFSLGGVIGSMLCAVWHIFHGDAGWATVWLGLALSFKMDYYNA